MWSVEENTDHGVLIWANTRNGGTPTMAEKNTNTGVKDDVLFEPNKADHIIIHI
jgi:hypothetical protein